MAKIKPASIVAAISGKLFNTENAYLKTNKRSGSICVSHYPKKKAIISESQRQAFDAFGERVHAASQWLNVNKPTPDNPMGTEAYQQMRKAFESQRKIGVWFSYVVKHFPND